MSAIIVIPTPPAPPTPPTTAAQFAVAAVSMQASLFVVNGLSAYSTLNTLVFSNPGGLAPQDVMNAIEANNPGNGDPATIINLINNTATLLQAADPSFAIPASLYNVTINSNGTVTIAAKV